MNLILVIALNLHYRWQALDRLHFGNTIIKMNLILVIALNLHYLCGSTHKILLI